MIEIDMEADDVLKLPGYASWDAVRQPEQIGSDDLGHVVKWFYSDVTITLRRYGDPLCYRVTEIDWHQNLDADGIVRLDRRLPKDTEDMAFAGLSGVSFELPESFELKDEG